MHSRQASFPPVTYFQAAFGPGWENGAPQCTALTLCHDASGFGNSILGTETKGNRDKKAPELFLLDTGLEAKSKN